MSAVDVFLEVIRSQTKVDKWMGSHLETFRRVASTNRGEIGEEFIRCYLAQFGIESHRAKNRVAKCDIAIGIWRFLPGSRSIRASPFERIPRPDVVMVVQRDCGGSTWH